MMSALSPLIPGPNIAHSGLFAVALDVKTANSMEYVRIHSVRSHSVSVVTRAHNTTRKMSAGSTSTFPWSILIVAVDMRISQTATTLAVLYKTREAN